jgi:hypothetical protein
MTTNKAARPKVKGSADRAACSHEPPMLDLSLDAPAHAMTTAMDDASTTSATTSRRYRRIQGSTLRRAHGASSAISLMATERSLFVVKGRRSGASEQTPVGWA